MGVDHHSYIGPYLRVTEITKKEKVDSCESHNFPVDASFCPKCGNSKQSRYKVIEINDAPDDWEEEYVKNGKTCCFWDYLTSTSVMSGPDVEEKNGKRIRTYIYLPNQYFDELDLPKIDGGKYSEEEVPFDKLDIPELTRKFTDLYTDEIVYLKQWFEVEVKFGYIGWCS
jgi:hypothetical protein